jgi:hypothetical protein
MGQMLIFPARRAIRRPKLERLGQLLQKKVKTDAKLMACQLELNAAFLTASEPFRAGVNERVEALA